MDEIMISVIESLITIQVFYCFNQLLERKPISFMKMETNSSFNTNLLSNKLKNHFDLNIEFILKYSNKVFIITKSDIFYEIDIKDETILSFILNNDKSILESKMIVKQLCHKNTIDLSYGFSHYFARTIDNGWGRSCYGVFGNGK
jgi:hypothetical protein